MPWYQLPAIQIAIYTWVALAWASLAFNVWQARRTGRNSVEWGLYGYLLPVVGCILLLRRIRQHGHLVPLVSSKA
jgi:hypothetical protein